jgi:hypothetical protein
MNNNRGYFCYFPNKHYQLIRTYNNQIHDNKIMQEGDAKALNSHQLCPSIKSKKVGLTKPEHAVISQVRRIAPNIIRSKSKSELSIF